MSMRPLAQRCTQGRPAALMGEVHVVHEPAGGVEAGVVPRPTFAAAAAADPVAAPGAHAHPVTSGRPRRLGRCGCGVRCCSA